jgi:hypothetical protein
MTSAPVAFPVETEAAAAGAIPVNGKIYKLASNISFARNFARRSSAALK